MPDLRNVYRSPPEKCRLCRHPFTALGGQPVEPREGDFNICIQCGALHVLNADRTHRDPTPEEAKIAETHEDVQVIRMAITYANKVFKKVH